MVSYWKLINLETAEVIGVGKEQSLSELKMLYENKLNTQTKMIKCFGKDNYNKDWKMLKLKCMRLMEECNINVKCREINILLNDNI